MISTENVSPSTSLTVSEMPSSATEPLGAMKRASSAGTRNDSATLSRKSSRAHEFGEPVDMAADHMAAELVAEPQRAFEIELGAAPPVCGGGHAQRLGRGIDGEGGPVCRLRPRSTTVRQIPEQAIEAPMAIESGS